MGSLALPTAVPGGGAQGAPGKRGAHRLAGHAVLLPAWEGAGEGDGGDRSQAPERGGGPPPRASGAAAAWGDGWGSGSRRHGLWGPPAGAQAGGSGGGTLQRGASDGASRRRGASCRGT